MKRKITQQGFKWEGNAKDIREALRSQREAIMRKDNKQIKSTLAHVLHTCVSGDIN
jgi:hypothetical protein